MSGWGTLAKIGGFAAAPFTGGWSIPAGMAVGAGLDAAGKPKAGGGGTTATTSPSADLDPYSQILQNNAKRLNLTGSNLADEGTATFAPAVQYFQNLLSDSGGAVDQATKAVRGKVIDQYDTARQAIAKFAPRGGGQVSALAASRFGQAHDLSDITASMQSDAASKLGTLGTTMTGLGLSAQQIAGSDIATLIQAVLGRRSLDLTEKGLDITKRGQDRALYGDLGQAAGNIIGTILLGGQGSND